MQGQKDTQELIAFLLNQVNELKQIIEELKSKLTDYETQKNSNNSSKPPSRI